MTVDNARLGTDDVVWLLDDLYTSMDDELIGDDIDLCKQEAELIREQCSGRLSRLEPAVFARTVRRLERIAEHLARLAAYAYLNFSTRVKEPAAGAFLQKITEVASAINKELVFFTLEWARMEEKTAAEFLEFPELKKYRHHLKKIRRQAEHLLSESREQLLLELEPVGRGSWTLLFEKVMVHQQFGKEKRTEEEVLSDLYSPDRGVRKQAALDLSQGLREQLHVLTHIFNTLAAEKMIDDRLRSYSSWDQAIHLENELEGATVATLITSVVDRYDIVAGYYRLKKELLGLDVLYDYDRYAPVPGAVELEISWEQCRDMVLGAFADFSGRMAEIAAMFFENRWIHAPVLEGKQGGAFAHPCVPAVHPYVMVNYTGNLRDVSTVAHELGHGVHQYLAAEQGFYNADTPLVLAETASVFAELLVFKAQLKLLDDPAARRAFICQKLESIFATVFRQVAMNRFEDAMHTARRSKGELSAEQLSEFWLTSQKPMFGDSITLTEDYGIWWSYIPHFLGTPGYVYSYAFGELLVLALYGLYQRKGEGFVDKYLALLAAGGSRSPADLLSPFEITLTDSSFWHGGLNIIEQMLADVEEEK
jgi:oligoendopeptidase F